MNFVEWLRGILYMGSPADSRSLQHMQFPPKELDAEWKRIEGYIRRYENDRAEILKNDPEFKDADADKKAIFTPVPLAQEMARLSSALLFSAEPKLIHETKQDVLDRVIAANSPGEFLLETGEHVAVQGYGALRVIRDEEISDVPLLTFVPANRVIWRVRHGRFVVGGYVVIERQPNPFSDEVYRLVENHLPGVIERSMYRGNRTSLGSTLPPEKWLEEFSGLPERTEHRLDAPTLYRWNNVPGGRSDLAGLDTHFDRLNEYESIGVDKMRKSVPVTLVDRKIADRQGRVKLHGVVFTGGQGSTMGDGVAKTVETIQPALQSEEHIAFVRHLRESILMYGGYSLASWGLDDGGSADSGKALRLRQARTLLTKAGKERSARSAITQAFAAACAWAENASSVEDYRPELMLGDGLPTDPLEDAQEAAIKRGAGVESLEQAIRELHPDWDEKAVEAEIERIEKENDAKMPPMFSQPRNPIPEEDEDPEDDPEEDAA